MYKKLLVSLAVIVLVYAVLPANVIDFIGKFAIGWMIMDIVSYFVEDWIYHYQDNGGYMNKTTEALKPLPKDHVLIAENILRWHIRLAVFAGFVAGYIFKGLI